MRRSDPGYRKAPYRRRHNPLPAALARLRAGESPVWVTVRGERLELIPEQGYEAGDHLVAYDGRVYVRWVMEDGTLANDRRISPKILARVRSRHNRAPSRAVTYTYAPAQQTEARRPASTADWLAALDAATQADGYRWEARDDGPWLGVGAFYTLRGILRGGSLTLLLSVTGGRGARCIGTYDSPAAAPRIAADLQAYDREAHDERGWRAALCASSIRLGFDTWEAVDTDALGFYDDWNRLFYPDEFVPSDCDGAGPEGDDA